MAITAPAAAASRVKDSMRAFIERRRRRKESSGAEQGRRGKGKRNRRRRCRRRVCLRRRRRRRRRHSRGGRLGLHPRISQHPLRIFTDICSQVHLLSFMMIADI